MTARRRPRPQVTPRIWSAQDVAHRLSMAENTFKGRLPDLKREGFPEHDGLLGGWDIDAVEAWLDRRSGLASPLRDVDDGGAPGSSGEDWIARVGRGGNGQCGTAVRAGDPQAGRA